MCQKLDLIETESETYKSQMYGQDNLCHPYILSTTVLSDISVMYIQPALHTL